MAQTQLRSGFWLPPRKSHPKNIFFVVSESDIFRGLGTFSVWFCIFWAPLEAIWTKTVASNWKHTDRHSLLYILVIYPPPAGLWEKVFFTTLKYLVRFPFSTPLFPCIHIYPRFIPLTIFLPISPFLSLSFFSLYICCPHTFPFYFHTFLFSPTTPFSITYFSL